MIVSLADAVLTANTGLDAIKRAPIVEEDTGVKCLRIQDISQKKNYQNWGNTKVEAKNFNKFQLKEDDILIARTGGSIGVNLIIKDELQSVYNNGLIRMRVNKDEYDPNFIYYVIQSRAYWGHINSIAFSTSTQPNMKIKNFLRFEFRKFTLPEQKAIAQILGKLDDKIELNRQMNQTLENMAQALFQSWFVDFDPVIDNALLAANDIPETLQKKVEKRLKIKAAQGLQADERFPNSFVYNEELGRYIPEGWEIASIYDVMDITYGAPFSSKEFNNDGVGMPIIRIRDLKTGKPQNYSEQIHPKGILINMGDVLVGMDAEFKPCIWFGKDGFLNQRLFRAKPKQEEISNYFIFYSLKPLLSYEEQAQVGTTVAHLGKKDIDKFRIILPSKELLKVFKSTTVNIFSRYLNTFSQTQTLTQLRDTLLPQLISGKLKVPAAMLKMEETLK